MAPTNRVTPGFLTLREPTARTTSGHIVNHGNSDWYRIDGYDFMPPFLVSLTSPADHWVFLSTSGGITAGRRNADNAIFPYATVDRVTDSASTTGAVTVVIIGDGDARIRWEPFNRSLDGIYFVRRSVEKNSAGNIITFEERNEDLGLLFRQTWTSSPHHGLVRKCELFNDGEELRDVRILDGVRNTLPSGTTTAFQTNLSNLLDAYKRNELEPETGFGIFGLSAVPTDKAEPSEALSATTWWHHGLPDPIVLLCADQLDRFRRTGIAEPERDIKGKRGAYLAVSAFALSRGDRREWMYCGEVNQGPADIADLKQRTVAGRADLRDAILRDVDNATAELFRLLSQNDGVQQTGNSLTSLHHEANVTYNIMRGGCFASGYDVSTSHLRAFIRDRNRKVALSVGDFLDALPDRLRIDDLQHRARANGDPDLCRLVSEYLPLTFSRRHGDPSRPWNAFSIETRNEDGSTRLAYEGNWRDIFQNWEALLQTSPLYITSAISKFLCAMTLDGYNPYRISDAGIDWERPEAQDPWANIGYWSDHQIIYLQKLLELSEKYQPGALRDLLTRDVFSFADVPYRIAPFDRMIRDPHDTISFDPERDEAAAERCAETGGDGRLVHGSDQATVLHANMTEKLLILALAKVTNFVPAGGIWMNTQRPEWNDANNALVGKGVSVVTVAYLQRYAASVTRLLRESDVRTVTVFENTRRWMQDLLAVLRTADDPEIRWSAHSRLDFMRRCALAGDTYRAAVTAHKPSFSRISVPTDTLTEFFELTERIAGATVGSSRRADQLYHSYNTLQVSWSEQGEPTGVQVVALYEMLEGQVAAISSPSVEPEQSVRTLRALRESSMFREDQNSYMLYPNRARPGFMERNVISEEAAGRYPVVLKFLDLPVGSVLTRDVEGGLHFNVSFRNAGILRDQCRQLAKVHPEVGLTERDVENLAELYEEVFHHGEFTGRSGTFYGYEGLGSIYWHMVSKLLLAVQENALEAHRNGDDETAAHLREHYFDIRGGLGFNKSPREYGAFPTDPYSHTPHSGGARQPGMTGQVKEEVITRLAELGLIVLGGCLQFDPFLIQPDEFSTEPARLTYVGVDGVNRTIDVGAGDLAYTFCQVPLLVSRGGSTSGIVVHEEDGSRTEYDELRCPANVSRAIFEKSGRIVRVEVNFAEGLWS